MSGTTRAGTRTAGKAVTAALARARAKNARLGSSVAALVLALAFYSSLRGVSLLRSLHREYPAESLRPQSTEPSPRPAALPSKEPKSQPQPVVTAATRTEESGSATSPPPSSFGGPAPHAASAYSSSRGQRNISVVSYSVYGNNTKYLIPLLHNVRRLVPRYYPGWQIRVYHDSSVPPDFLAKLRRSPPSGVDVDVRLVNVERGASDPSSEPLLNASWSSFLPRLNPMTWRLLVASDPTVDAYVIRDSDSVPNEREKAAVEEWLSTPGAPAFHLMHDHPRHYSWQGTSVTMLGCCWGGRGGRAAPDMADLLRESYGGALRNGWRKADGSFYYSDDQDFLHLMVYPSVLALGPGGSVRHNSFECEKNDGVAFPTAGEWDLRGYDFVGEIMRLRRNESSVDDIGYTIRGRDEIDSGACWLHHLMQIGSSWRKRYRRCLRRRFEYGFRNATDVLAGKTPPPGPRGCVRKSGSITNRERMIGGRGPVRRIPRGR